MSITIPKTSTRLRVLYLDDDLLALENFENNINLYNVSDDAFIDNCHIDLTNSSSYEETVDILSTHAAFDVFVCDHNMPQQKGLEFIKFYKVDHPEMVYVLHTGAGNMTDNLKWECQKYEIMLSNKSESFSTLIEKIIKAKGMKANPIEVLYQTIIAEVLKDLMEVRNDESMVIMVSNKNLKPADLIMEIRQKSPIGVQFLINYFNGLKFFKQ
jgi:CheY-like chemotaxis protein